MKQSFYGRCLVGLAALSSVALMTSCVDNDYDLSDVDMNVNIGGNLTLPPSSTDVYTMEQILNLDANSSIKPDGAQYGLAQGDYVLVQEGDPTESTYRIDKVSITDLRSTSENTTLDFIGVGSDVKVYADVRDLTNIFNLEDNNVDRQLVSAQAADVNIKFEIAVKFESLDNYNGKVFISPGFEIAFPKEWVIQGTSTEGWSVSGNHKLVCNAERTIGAGSTFKLTVTATHIDLSNAPAGQGLYAPGKFYMEEKIISNGRIGISSGSLAQGARTRIKLTITPAMTGAVLNGVTGRVNPRIDVEPTSFSITGVPDFLMEDGNNLDIENPRINIAVVNGSAVDVTINGVLKAYYSNKAPLEIGVGSNYGTDPIVIKGNGKTVICLSRKGEGADVAAGEVNVRIPKIGELISTIPDRIELKDIKAQVPQDRNYTFTLGTTYDFKVNYKAVVPLAFGPDLRFVYNKPTDGWDEDLSKYNFKEVIVHVKVLNTAPLDMKPTVDALGKDGNVLKNITAAVEGEVKAGSLGHPTESEMKIVLRSTGANIGGLDGVQFEFEATSSPEFTGVPLNAAQALKFTEVRLQLVGGVDIDLN